MDYNMVADFCHFVCSCRRGEKSKAKHRKPAHLSLLRPSRRINEDAKYCRQSNDISRVNTGNILLSTFHVGGCQNCVSAPFICRVFVTSPQGSKGERTTGVQFSAFRVTVASPQTDERSNRRQVEQTTY